MTRSKLDSSVSVSSVDEKVIQDFHPQSEGDLLRLLPGIQPNISGPGGNGNFAVRGLPVATGGATFVQLQEDGLPTVLYGDIQFGNNDYWTKSNPTDTRVEDLRGGTAATLASQAPGAVVNYIGNYVLDYAECCGKGFSTGLCSNDGGRLAFSAQRDCPLRQ